MEEKAHYAELQKASFGEESNNLNLHTFKLDSSQDAKNENIIRKERKKKLFKPMNHSEMLLAKINMITTTTFFVLETVNRTYTCQLNSEFRTGHAASVHHKHALS